LSVLRRGFAAVGETAAQEEAAVLLQREIVVVPGVDHPGPGDVAAKCHRAFDRGGMRVNTEVGYVWRNPLRDRAGRVCRLLDSRTRDLADKVTAFLLPIVRR